MQVELEKEDIEALKNMLNTATFQGKDAEMVVRIKKQLSEAREDGKRD